MDILDQGTMEHFIRQDDFLENNLLSAEDLCFDAENDGSRMRCTAMLGIRCDSRCVSCESQDGPFEEFDLGDANDDIMRAQNEGQWNHPMDYDNDLLLSSLNGDMPWMHQTTTGPKFPNSEAVAVSERAKIPSRPNIANVAKRCAPQSQSGAQKKPLSLPQSAIEERTNTKGKFIGNDKKLIGNSMIRHDDISLILSSPSTNSSRKDNTQVSGLNASNDFGSDLLNEDHNDGSSSPDQLTSSSSDSGLSGGEWTESGENFDHRNFTPIILRHKSEHGSPVQLKLIKGSQESMERANASPGDRSSDGSPDDEIWDPQTNCTQNPVRLIPSSKSCQRQQRQQYLPQQQPIHFSHQLLQQVPLVQQSDNILSVGEHQQQQVTQVICQLPPTLLQATANPQIEVVANPTMFIPVGSQGTMLPVMTSATSLPFASQQKSIPTTHTQRELKSANRSRAPPQQRQPSGGTSKEDALARKRQRMIRNRESALQSRQRRMEETQLLQDEVGSLRIENTHLKDENANLKKKIAVLEGRLRVATSKGAILCVFGLVVMFNLGVGYPRASTESPVLKNHIANSLERHIPPVQRVVATALKEERHRVGVNSRHLLWMNETRGNRIQGLPFADSLPQGKPGCGGQWVNSTESLLVQEYLSRWASQAWALASSNTRGSQLSDVLQPQPFLRRSSPFWPTQLSSFDADPVDAIEGRSRTPADRSSVASKELPLPPSWPSRALLSEVRQRNDTFYLLAFSGPPDTVLLSARQANSTARPKIAVLMPAIASAKNDTIKIPPGRVAVMQIDCEVVQTKTLYLRRSLLPKNLQVAMGTTQQRPHLRHQTRTGLTATAKKQRRKP